jgi:hypothetical protein
MSTLKEIIINKSKERKQKKCTHEINNIIDTYTMETYGKRVEVTSYKCIFCDKISTISTAI